MHLRALLIAALLFTPAWSRAESSLDLQSWLDRPGVRAVVVEFYATWCEPCMKAMPRWKALKEKYGKDGLRVIVVNTRDEDDPGKCVSLGWTPDALICDTEGVIDERFGVKGKLPSAFLWSWEHKLLVQRGHVTEVEAAVEALFKALPRVEVTADGAEKDVVEEVTAAINYSAKMRVVASEAERKKLRDMRLAQQSAHVSDDSRCETGKEVAPNSSLVVSLAKDRSIKLKLIDLESGCVTQNSAGATARDAVENLIGKLRVPLEWPSAGKRTTPAPAVKPAVAEGRIGGASNDFDVSGADDVVASFESEPEGAVVLLDGKVLCAKAPCTKTIAAGRHDVTMSVEQYEDATASIAFSRTNKKARLSLTPAFGLVSVDTVPQGMPVFIDGKPVGNAPVADLRLDPGAHAIVARDECHLESGERIVVEKGKTRRLKIEPLEKLSAVKVSAADDKGNDLEAEVEVDGRALGSTPLTAKVATCSKEIVLKAPGGRVWKQALALREKETTPVQAVIRSSDCPEGMVLIKGGTFDMGSTEGDDDEKPVHRVTISSFCLDRTEVTTGAYERWRKAPTTVDWKDSIEEQRRANSALCNGGKADKVNHPINCVDWTNAKAYCEQRGARLPTEAEWEFAARGSMGRKFPWGDSAPNERRTNACGAECKRKYPNFNTAFDGDDGWAETAPVGSFPLGATPEGVQDLAGNVREWTTDCYGDYAGGAQKDPEIKQNACQARVDRGGGWGSDAAWLRASYRCGDAPAGRGFSVGFRCARGVSF